MIAVVRDETSIAHALPVLASGAYLGTWSADTGWFADEHFILPFYIARESPFTHVVFTADTVRVGASSTVEKEVLFLNDVVAAVRRMGADFISQPKTTAVFRTVPNGSTHVRWGAYRLDLSPGEDALFAGLHPHHRRVIRKARRDGVVVERGEHVMGACHELVRGTLMRERKPFLSLDQLRTLRTRLGENVDFYLASRDGVPHAAAFLISDRSSCYYIVGGTHPDRHNGAAALLHWTALLEKKRQGVEIYDFVGGRVWPASGSRQEGLQVFKARFGARFHSGYLWKYPIRPWKFRTYYFCRRLRDIAEGTRYREDMIDNEIRTNALPRSRLIVNGQLCGRNIKA
jgi:hypothetical protein